MKLRHVGLIALLGAITLSSCNINLGGNSTKTSTSASEASESTAVASTTASSTVTNTSTSVATSTTKPSTETSTSVNPSTSNTPSKTHTSTTITKTDGEMASHNDINLSETYCGNEVFMMEFNALSGKTSASDYQAFYKASSNTTYTELTNESGIILVNNNVVKVYFLGLPAGAYDFKVQVNNDPSKYATSGTVAISAEDRSGYAFFKNSTGVGAYNNDGSLKANTTVVYVTDATKNTVKATIAGKEVTGLANIIKKQSSSSNPLDIRILDKITAATWNQLTVTAYSEATTSTVKGANNKYLSLKNYSEDEIISGGFNTLNTTTYSKLDGLTNKIKYDSSKKEFDSYYNMLDVSSVNNVTVEGIGTNAGLFQWGFTWSNCKNIEIKNLTFSDYTEDACSFQGSSNITASGNYWIHNNTFNKGKNYWDVCSEQDKHYGDGATDFKEIHGVTSSYNQFNQCKKTGLVGGSNSQKTMDITFHHNFYNQVGSRLPLGRQANMHFYNNYYYGCTTCQDIRANAFVLSEANYFKSCQYPQKVSVDATYTGTVIKSYNDVLDDCGSSQATVVTDRTKTLSGNCNPTGSTNYTNFDTNSSLFYYDSEYQESKVSIMTKTADVPTFVPLHAGAGNIYKSFNLVDFEIEDTSGVTKYTVTFSINGTNTNKAVKENEKVTKPNDPYLKDNKFLGWYNGDTQFDFNTPITSNITLVAKFESEVLNYETISSSSNCIFSENFSSYTVDSTLSTVDFTKKGVYAGTSADTGAKIVTIGNNKGAQTVDNSSTAPGNVYAVLGTNCTSGIITGYVEVSIGANIGSKWILLALSNNDALQFSIGLDDSKNFAYRLTDSTDWQSFSKTLAGAKNTTYKIKFILNLNANTATVVINDETYLENATIPSNLTINTIFTMTNSSGTGSSSRTVTLANIAVKKED